MHPGAARRIVRLVALVAVPAASGCSAIIGLEDHEAFPNEAGAEAAPTTGGDAAADAGSLVQQATAQGSNTRLLVVTLSNAPAKGNALILVTASTNGYPLSITSGGVQLTKQSSSGAHVALTVWAGFASSTGSPITATVTFPAAPAAAQQTAAAHFSEWAGPAALGQQVVDSGPGATISTAPLVVNDGTALLFAAAGAHNDALGAPTNGFTALDTVAVDDLRLVSAYRLAPPAGSYMTSWSDPGAQGWDTSLVSFTR